MNPLKKAARIATGVYLALIADCGSALRLDLAGAKQSHGEARI